MDDDNYIDDDFFSALYVALDTLESLDPSVRKEEWFKFLEKTLDKTLAPGFKNAMNPTKH